jgi:hypothetical protein
MLLCGSGTTGCHGIITENPENAGLLGYTVTLARLGEISRNREPSPWNVPVWRWSRELGKAEWVLLDDDGGITPELELI